MFLTAVNASTTVAQNNISPQKHATIKKLFEVTNVQSNCAAFFEESVTQYQRTWASAVITDFRTKGLFKGLSPKKTLEMEGVVKEFGDKIFNEIKRRVVQQFITVDGLESLSAPAFDKYLTDDEINALITFCQTPAGKKLVDVYAKTLRNAITSTLAAKGFYKVLPSPEAEQAKVDKFSKEIENNPASIAQQIFAAAKLSPDEFTHNEIVEIVDFSKTPVGKKLTDVSPKLIAEVLTNNTKLYAPQIGQLTQKVINEQMVWFQNRTNEVIKKP